MDALITNLNGTEHVDTLLPSVQLKNRRQQLPELLRVLMDALVH